MKKLFVLYDASCGLCVRCARWLKDQPAFIEVEPIPAGSRKAAALFPGLPVSPTPDELLVIADTGEVYRDLAAWLMCLYALRRYRGWSIRLSRPGWQPLARRAVRFLTDYRETVSGALGMKPSFESMVAGEGSACPDGTCAPASPPSPLNQRIRDVRASAPSR